MYGAVDNKKSVLQVEYDFAKDGGAVGTVALRGGGLPAGAVVTSGMIDGQTSLTSDGSAQVALHVTAADDVFADAVIAGLAAGLVDVVPVGTAATAIKTTAIGGVTMTITVAALTAGKMVICLEYYITTG